MKLIFSLLIVLFAGVASFAQPAAACPPELVCITREAALKALEDSDARKKAESFIVILESAREALKMEVENMRREFIRVSAENTVIKQQRVEDRALFEFVLKNQRRKCYPFSICVGN